MGKWVIKIRYIVVFKVAEVSKVYVYVYSMCVPLFPLWSNKNSLSVSGLIPLPLISDVVTL